MKCAALFALWGTAAAAADTLTLDEALRTMRTAQPQLVLAQQQVDAANAAVDVSLSPWLPQIGLTLGYTRQSGNFTSAPGSVPQTTAAAGSNISWNTYDYLAGRLQVNQLIWDFGQTLNKLNSSKSLLEAGKLSVEAVLSSAILSVRTAYCVAIASRDQIEVAKATLDNMAAHLSQVEAFVRAGTRPDIDLATSRSDLANAKLLLVKARNTYEVAKATLNHAIGIERDTSFELADVSIPEVPEESMPLEQVVARALDSHPSIRALGAQARASEQAVRGAMGTYWPALGAQAYLSAAGRSFEGLAPNFGAGATLTWNLFLGGMVQGQVAIARSAAAQALSQSEIARQQVRLAVQQAMLDVAAGKQEIAAADEAHANAVEQLRLAHARYEAGVGSIIEWMDGQVSVTTAAANQVAAAYDLSSARARLLAALGR